MVSASLPALASLKPRGVPTLTARVASVAPETGTGQPPAKPRPVAGSPKSVSAVAPWFAHEIPRAANPEAGSSTTESAGSRQLFPLPAFGHACPGLPPPVASRQLVLSVVLVAPQP